MARWSVKRLLAHALALAVGVAVARAAYRSEFYSWPQGRGAMTDLLGTLASTASLYSILSIRALAAGRARQLEVEDGLLALAATAWVAALLPPRPENYWPAQAPDDFIHVWVPMSLLLAVAARATGALSAPRSTWRLASRLGALTSLGLIAVGLLVWVVGGPGSAGWLTTASSLAVVAGALAAAAFARAQKQS